MSEYTATVKWKKNDDEDFLDNQYSRGHLWLFDGGVQVPASSSPHIVPLPLSVEENVDPEEAFIASLSSCHMLFFLSLAVKRKLRVNEYLDQAIGVMEKTDDNKVWMTKVTLRPKVTFVGEKQPTRELLEKLHHQAHELCFIANSVKTEVVTEIIE